MYSQLDSMLGAIMGSVSQMLPKVPIVNIKDPLKGVDPVLAKAAQSNTPLLGVLDSTAASHLEVFRVWLLPI